MTKRPAVFRVGRPYAMPIYPKASIRLPIMEGKRFSRVSKILCTLWWRCFIERYNQR